MSKKAVVLVMLVVVLCGSVIGMARTGGSVWASEAGTPTQVPGAEPVMGKLDIDKVAALDLDIFPIIPEISDYAQQLYMSSLAQGGDTHSFIKVGDCMTDNPFFLRPIGEGDYALGEYEALQGVIEHFTSDDHNSFSRISQAAAGGFNAASILDSLWANPEYCKSGETPLACEMRLMQPSIALIMFGTNDVFYLDAPQFDFFLRSIVFETIRNDALPVLSTFPHRPEFPEKSILYNQIVVQIAQDYDIPLINLWRALESLPNQGVDPEETTHMTAPESGAVCHFLGENMQAGFTVRNLITLQTLDAILQSVAVES